MKLSIIILLSIGLVAERTFACFGKGSGGGSSGDGGGNGNNGGGGKEPGSGDIGGGDGGGGSGDPFKDLMGTSTDNTKPYDGARHANNNGAPVGSSDDLSCNFEGDACCWANIESDVLEWRLSSEPPNNDLFTKHFNAPPPTDTYLVTAAAKAKPDDDAQFVSCTIGCSKEDTLVTLDHWATSNAAIAVCKRALGSTELTDCQIITRGESPGPSLLALPAGSNFEVVIRAYNFIADGGDIAIIDNVVVSYEPCGGSGDGGNNGTTQPPIGGGDAFCQAVQCDFESSLCEYKDVGLKDGDYGDWTGKMVPFAYTVGQYGPQNTGPREAANGDGYMAANLHPDKAAAIYSDLDATEEAVVSFDYWKATDEITGFVCFNEPKNCVLEVPSNVQAGDREWKHVDLIIPQGTKRLIIGAVNRGPNIGPIAVDNIRLFKNAGGKPGESRCVA